jgi:hypothetical protein
MIYENKTHYIPSIQEIISSLNEYKVDIILVGGEAGKLYNLCKSENDIDFILNTSEDNMQNMFQYVSSVFNIPSYEEFKKLSRIMFVTQDSKPIDFIKNSKLVNFDDINKRVKYFDYHEKKVKVINVEDYVSYIKVYLKYIEKNIDSYTNKQKYLDKIVRYKQLIDNYYSLP